MTQDTDIRKKTLFEIRLEVLEEIRAKGINPFGYKFERTCLIADCLEPYEEGKDVRLAGRITACRDMGKTHFWDIHDSSGKIQLFLNPKALNEKDYELLKYLNAGDIIGIHGTLFKTKTGETSVRTQDLTLLSKSLHPMPEKYHGLKDVEARFRHRYLDLIANHEVKTLFLKRSKIIQTLRSILDKDGFLEVETPMLHPLCGGAVAKPFSTHHNSLSMDLYLRIAPELYLKKLLVGGMEKVYELNRNFRNEGLSRFHNPEFTMLEIYSAYDNYLDMMNLCEKLIQTCASSIRVDEEAALPSGNKINIFKPFKRITLFESVKTLSGFVLETPTDLKKIAENEQFENWQTMPDGIILNELFERHVQEKLIEPTFVTDYPSILCPLAKTKPDNPELTERFELFIDGQEIANAYSELNNPLEQKLRLEEQLKNLPPEEMGKKEIDHDFIFALEHAMPPAGGLGIGIDRLAMILTGAASIREVILFPLLRPEELSGA
ncbi:MAG: lysine--tRNA ligase [Candidatus Aureabacteria bacterium]|nr:lysine--tRNA ligase [Candidatus Auribacterota bacterium]